MSERWKVVEEDVRAREGVEVVARELPERLPKGAVVEELLLAGDALHFKRVSGIGPLSGWVSIKTRGGKDLLVRVPTAPVNRHSASETTTVPRASKSNKAGVQPHSAGTGHVWEVCGDSLYVQKGQRLSSMKLPQALRRGTQLEEVERVGDRLHFVNHSGVGPASGWVSILEKGKEVLKRFGEEGPLSLDDAKADLFIETTSKEVVSPNTAKEVKDGKQDQPLGGWAAMAQLYGRTEAKPARGLETDGAKAQGDWTLLAKRHGLLEKQTRAPQPAAAAELAALPEELPPTKQLQQLDEGDLTKLLGLDAVIAHQFSGLAKSERAKIIEKKRDEVERERQETLEKVKRAEQAEREAEAAAAAAAEAEAEALANDGAPLGGWAALLHLLGKGGDPVLGEAAVAAETLRARRLGRELPPVDELSNLEAGPLAELMGLDAMAAKELAALSSAQRRKVVAEAKALIEMEPTERKEFLDRFFKAWPRGPFPELTAPVEEPSLLPPGSCFPYSRHLREVPIGRAPEWGLDSPASRALLTFFKRRATSHPEAQKEFLRSLTCNVVCTGSRVEADASAVRFDPCRVSGSADKDQVSGAIAAKAAVRPDDALRYLNAELHRRVLLLDGDMAARLGQEGLGEVDYRGERFKNFKEMDASGKPILLAGNVELLALTKGAVVGEAHREYLLAGADIIRTNTYGANALTQADYGMHKLVYEMNKASTQLAKKIAAEVTKQDPAKPRFVAGVLGPTAAMASLSPDIAWDALVDGYEDQVKGLVDGGADILMLDGITDSLNAKAAVFAIDVHFGRSNRKRMPLLMGVHIVDNLRTPSGQSVEAFHISMRHTQPLALGLTSTLGAKELQVPCRAMASLHVGWCSACPGAAGVGPQDFAASVLDLAKEECVNLVGGGVGVLPSHIKALAERLGEKGTLRSLPPLPKSPLLQLAGLDACAAGGGFQVVGSQCTVMGSARFKRMIGAYKATSKKRYLQEALKVCIEQCEKGADILDFNLDSDLTSGPCSPAKGALTSLLRLASSEPRVAKVPFMLCSCEWHTIREGLRSVHGKCIVNGLTLMLGELEFLRIARECMAHGAALVVLPLTDRGEPAEAREEKVRICQRSYQLLRSKLDFPPEDIIFDCQVLPLGLPEFAGRASDFIGAVEELKRTCPYVSFIAGLNNLSLPFRGLNMLRDALHSVFLSHAIPKGLNLAIGWPGALPLYSDIDSETRVLCEEMVLNKSTDANHLDRFSAFVNFRADTATCLPVRSPRLQSDVPGGKAPAMHKEAAEMQRALRSNRKAAPPEEQKLFLRELGCKVQCRAQALKPDAGAGLRDLGRLEGLVDQEKVARTVVAKAAVSPDELAKYYNAELLKRVFIVATPASGRTLTEAEYKEYFDAGCDICGTGTLASTAYEETKAAAQLAKSAAAVATKADSAKPRFVAGVLGPTEHSLSSSPSAEDPSLRSATWEELVATYAEQVRGLVDGGADLLSIEMVSDTLNAKAAIYAIDEYFTQSKKARPPVFITAVITGNGRMPCGQSIEAFCVSVGHAKPLSLGVSGPLGAESTRRAIEALTGLRGRAWCHASGTGASASLTAYADKGLLNLAGVCGLSAADLAPAAQALRSRRPRALPAPDPAPPPLRLAGLEVLEVQQDSGNVQLVGQRCNLGGSERFRGLVDAYKYTKRDNRWEAALGVCIEQRDAGADILDFNFDSDLIDTKWAMGKFLRLCASNAKVATVPFVLSSAEWPAIEVGLRNVQGKSVVNALSFVQGEEEFLRLAKACLRYGAAVVVMTMDSPKEQSSFQARVNIGQRAYELLRKKLNFPAEDIIFDCNIAPLDREGSARDFIEAVAELKRTCLGVSFIGGVGNLSLMCRGTPPLREALHSVFICHAVPVGLNMAIVDVGKLPRMGDIEAQTKKICEEAISNESEDGNHIERLELYVSYLSGGAVVEVHEAAATLPTAVFGKPPNPGFTQPIRVLVQGTGTLTNSIFQQFGSKAHTALTFHRTQACLALKRQVWFSSISGWMGQGGTGATAGASTLMDCVSLRERAMSLQNMGTAVEWGPVGEIGLRRTLYGSRDVFAQFDLGQKLLSPENAQWLMRMVCCQPHDPYEVIGLVFLDQAWQMTLAGVSAGSGLGADRKTFADA